jgi:uncharacterized protein YrrD
VGFREEVFVHRVSEIIGKPIVSTETGDQLGSVSDALVAGERVVGLVVGVGLFAKEHVLPFGNVQTLGGDTVLARTEPDMPEPAQWRHSGVKPTRCSAILGKPVVTTGGRRLGEVSDLLINAQTGTFGQIEVMAHGMAGLRTGCLVVCGSEHARIGPDTIVVPDAAIEDPNTEDGRNPWGQEAS